MKSSIFKEDKGLAVTYGRKWFKTAMGDTYAIDPNHIKVCWKGKKTGIPYCIVNNADHKSVDLASKKEVDQKFLNRLNYLTQESFWLARLKRFKLPLKDLIIYLMAGAGLWHFIRLILLMWGFSV